MSKVGRKVMRVFKLQNGEYDFAHPYPPMVPNPNGMPTPVGEWVKANAPKILGYTKTGRPQVQAGGKGTGHSKTILSYNPGFHLSPHCNCFQFCHKDGTWDSSLWYYEAEFCDDFDYSNEAQQNAVMPNGKINWNLCGMRHIPWGGFYRRKTNPAPDTPIFYVSGAMKLIRVIPWDEVIRENNRLGIRTPERRD